MEDLNELKIVQFLNIAHFLLAVYLNVSILDQL